MTVGMENNEIIEIVLAIRSELPRLLGENDLTTLQAIDSLLPAVPANKAAIDEIWDILTEREATQNWVTEYQYRELSRIRSNATKNASLPGDPSVIPVPKFKCPICNYTWSRHNVGRPIPTCPDHPQQILVPTT
jgi:hypothetical protein